MASRGAWAHLHPLQVAEKGLEKYVILSNVFFLEFKEGLEKNVTLLNTISWNLICWRLELYAAICVTHHASYYTFHVFYPLLTTTQIKL